MDIMKYKKINWVISLCLVCCVCVMASLTPLDWNIRVYTSLSSNQENYIDEQISYANTILNENEASVTVKTPNPPAQKVIPVTSLPDILYVGGSSHNLSAFDSYQSSTEDRIMIVQEIYVWNGSSYESTAGVTYPNAQNQNLQLSQLKL